MPLPYVLPITVSYIRHGNEDEWTCSPKLRDLIQTDFTGVATLTTARWEGQPPGSEKHYHVSVLMDVTPFVYDGKLHAPTPFIEGFKADAIELADARMKSVQPKATFIRESEDH